MSKTHEQKTGRTVEPFSSHPVVRSSPAASSAPIG